MKLKSILFTGAAVITASTPFAAFAGDVRGTVTDAEETVSIRAAEVRIVELDRVATTERDGGFSFSGVPAGTYTLEVSYVGAATQTQTVTVSETGIATANFALMGDGELYFCCTSGGAKELGQIFRLAFAEDGSARLQLFFESDDPTQFHYGDNLTVSPNGHLIVCEDQSGDVSTNHLRGITPGGETYPLGWLTAETELAGACWSPDGKTLFVNAYSPTATLAIAGPWVA